jgi:glycosyltransferase involved in cell wall biosynthesis
MHILILSDTENLGGAAIACSRLATGLIEAGHRVTRCFWKADHPPGRFYWKRVFLYPENAAPVEWDSIPNVPAIKEIHQQLIKIIEQEKPDIINVHNIHGGQKIGWGVGMVDICQQHAPTVWTMHDMWSFTGRCAYNDTCRKYQKGCDSTCPTPYEYPSCMPDKIAAAFKEKKDLITAGNQLFSVTPSKWMAGVAKKGIWAKKHLKTIPNGIDISRFFPMSKEFARKRLNLPNDKPVFLFIADNINDTRKGFDILSDALRLLRTEPFVLVTCGRDLPELSDSEIEHRHLGFIADPDLLVQAYNSADILIQPARHDNFPNTIVESLACGTAVIAFRTDGITEMIEDTRTGWLIDKMDARSLASAMQTAIHEITDKNHLPRLQERCRKYAANNFSLEIQAKRYIRLFENIIKNSHRNL